MLPTAPHAPRSGRGALTRVIIGRRHGEPAVRRQLETTLVVDSVPEYLVTGRRVPSSWIWRRLSRSVPRQA